MAQFTVTLANALPNNGESVTYNTASPTGFSEGASGADVTWDFSGLSSTGTLAMSGHDSASAPKSGTIPWSFYVPGVERVVRFDDFLYFYDLDGGEMTLIAKMKDASVIGQNKFAVVAQHTYNSPNCITGDGSECGIKPYTFPAAYGASRSTTQQYDWQNEQGADYFYKGTAKCDIDGHGTLKLPGGYEIPDVMRVTLVETYAEHQNSNYDPNQILGNATQRTVEWRAPFNRTPLVRYENFTGAAYETNYGVRTKLYYVDPTSAKLGYNSIYSNDQSLSLYPNPSKGLTRIAYNLSENANVEIKVLDLSGRTVDVFMNETQVAGPYNHAYDFSGLSQGTYIVQLSVNGVSTNKKLMVE